MAVIQLSKSDINNTQNKLPANSPVASELKPIGANAVIPITVAPSSGHLVCSTILTAAFNLVWPRFKFINMPSVTTMALSTSIPRAIISAPREIRCRSMANNFINIKVPKTVSNKIPPIKIPLFNPINISSTTITMAIASTRLTIKPSTDFSTSLGWLYTDSTCMPCGRWYSSSAKCSSIRLPTSTTFTLFINETPIKSACSEL